MARAPVLGKLLAAGVVLAGVLWGFEREAPDFAVFHEAWRLVLEGRGHEIYHATPDRFLYAPGFAWLLSPLGLLPRKVAFGLWCALKTGALWWLVRSLGVRLGAAYAAWAVVVLARPVLIDFWYGQINLLILAACAWALSDRARPVSPRASFVSWSVLGVAAVSKLFPLPLLLLPVLAGPWRENRLRIAGGMAGLVVTLVLPMFTLGFSGNLLLLVDWWVALVGRGFPLESHNQSFAAVMSHLFSGKGTFVIALHQTLPTGWRLLSEQDLNLLGLARDLADALSRTRSRRVVTVLPEIRRTPEGKPELVIPPEAGYPPLPPALAKPFLP